MNLPVKQCLFPKYSASPKSTWDFFGTTVTEQEREAMVNWLAANGMNGMIFLLSAGEQCPSEVCFWKDRDWGGDYPYWERLEILRKWAMTFRGAGAAFIPCFFCDGNESADIRNAPWHKQVHAFQLLTAILNPYVPGYLIGLESSEYFDTDQHVKFLSLLRSCTQAFPAQKYIGTHIQWNGHNPLPPFDFIAYEHPWQPGEGNEHTVEETVDVARNIMVKAGMPVIFSEYNLDTTGAHCKAQTAALLALNPGGIGGIL